MGETRSIPVLVFVTILGLGLLSYVPDLSEADVPLDKTWGQMRGVINKWGENPVLGHIRAWAFTGNINGELHKWARVFSVWTGMAIELEDPKMTRQPIEPGGKFEIQFYLARLDNLAEIRFDMPGYEIYIAGNWTVLNVTTSVTADEFGHLIDIARTSEPIVADAQGYLKVENDTETILRPFELKIEGVDVLKGVALRQMTSHIGVEFFDLDDDGIVDIKDLVKIARRYRAVPGMMGYSIDYDVNSNGIIDIGALTTIAANIGI